MPMYFPDLKSVQRIAKDMLHQDEDKKYKGIYPETEKDLPEARRQLAKYMREIWKDEVFAMEIELAVSEDNYNERLQEGVMKKMFKSQLDSMARPKHIIDRSYFEF